MKYCWVDNFVIYRENNEFLFLSIKLLLGFHLNKLLSKLCTLINPHNIDKLLTMKEVACF